MRKNLLFLFVLVSLSAFAQKRVLSYSPSNLPVFLDQTGDTFSKALLGGLNQPQFQALDINNDGRKDLLVHDRTGGIILPFINVGNNDITTYKYSPKYTAAFPKLKNTWVLFVDYDNDGKEDLWASIDFKVVLQRNITKTGDKMVKFQQVSPFLRAFKYSGIPGLDSVNISSSFNNIPTIADVDGDGDIDFFSYQAGEGNLLLYRNMTVDFSLPIHPPVFDLADLCWGDFRDTTFDAVWLKGCVYKTYRKKHSGGSTLLWFDNDNDGDLDLLMGNADNKNLIFLKNGKKDLGMTLDSIIAFDGYWPAGTTPVQLGSFPAAFMLDADGDGVKDILVAPNQVERTSKIEQTKQVLFYKNKGSNSFPDFKFEKKNYFTDEFLDHGGYTAPVLQDIDNDQDLDLLITTNGDHAKTGDKTYKVVLYRNIGSKTKPVFKLENEDVWGLGNDSLSFLSITFGDINGDGKTDMIAGDGYGGLSYYKNIGTSTTWAFTTPTKNYNTIYVGQKATPQLIDLDKDGKLDLVIGETDGNFNYYKNTGSTTNPQFNLVDDTLGNFIVNEFLFNLSEPDYWYIGNAAGEVADLDGDGKYDMVFGGDEGKVRVMKFDTYNQLNYQEDTTVLFDSAFMSYKSMDYGNNTHPTVGDLDGDGIKDIIVGNDRGGISFLKGKVEILGVTEIYKRNEPIVYPNPTNGSIVNINKKTKDEFIFNLYDLSGKLVQSETSVAGEVVHKMEVNTLSDGIYILQSSSKNNANYYTRLSVLKGK
jgi:hypothetical protein